MKNLLICFAFGLTLCSGQKSLFNNPIACRDSMIELSGEEFSCNDIDFLSFLSNDDLKVLRETFNDVFFEQSDVWGFQIDDKEITISCMTNAVVFIDSTNPIEPTLLGYVESPREEDFFCDVKVLDNTAYIAYYRTRDDGDNRNGIQVLDLSKLFVPENNEFQLFEPDFVYQDHGPVRNLVINTDAKILVSVGTIGGICEDGLHIINIDNRLEPVFLGCAQVGEEINDAQCIVYTGPDGRFLNNEICFAFSNRKLFIIDITDKTNPTILGEATTEALVSLSQGWLNGEQDFILASDLGDESFGTVSTATTYIVDVANLEEPNFVSEYNYAQTSVDGNLFFWGDIIARGTSGSPVVVNGPNIHYAYASNFGSGLRVLNTKGLIGNIPVLEEVAHFDTQPPVNDNTITGAISSFMHPSGVIALADIRKGIFFVQFKDAFTEPDIPTSTSPPSQTSSPTPNADNTRSPTSSDEGSEGVGGLPGGFAVLYLLIAVAAVGIIIFNIRLFYKKQPKDRTEKHNTQENVPTNNNVRGSQVNPMFEG